MNICLVNGTLGPVLERMGHRVYCYSCHEGHSVSATDLVKQAGFTPDVLIQKETLAAKVLISGLNKLDCIKVFWSIDTHLNYYWQWHYALLFDVFFTPHPAYLQNTAHFWSLPQIHGLAECAYPRPFVPHKDRAYFVNTVARLTANRDQRSRVHNCMLQHYGTGMTDNLSYAAMLDLYGQSRVVVNECIANETNFRLLEGAASGSCVISPPIGADQDSLFTPGKELLVYHDALELMHWLNHCKAHPHFAEGIGRAAWEKAHSAHLLEHRAASLLQNLSANTSTCSDQAQCSTRFAHVAGMLGIARKASSPELATLFSHMQDDTLRLTLTLTRNMALHHEQEVRKNLQESRQHVEALLRATPASPPTPVTPQGQTSDPDQANGLPSALRPNTPLPNTPLARKDAASLAVLCGGAALNAGDVEESAHWLSLYEACLGSAAPPASMSASPQAQAQASSADGEDLDAEERLYAHWMDRLHAHGRRVLYGMHFGGYCQTSLDFIYMMLAKRPLSPVWARRVLASPALCRSNQTMAQAAAARLSMNEPNIENESAYLQACLTAFELDEAQSIVHGMLDRLPLPRAKASLRAVLLRQNPHLGLLLPS